MGGSQAKVLPHLSAGKRILAPPVEGGQKGGGTLLTRLSSLTTLLPEAGVQTFRYSLMDESLGVPEVKSCMSTRRRFVIS